MVVEGEDEGKEVVSGERVGRVARGEVGRPWVDIFGCLCG